MEWVLRARRQKELVFVPCSPTDELSAVHKRLAQALRKSPDDVGVRMFHRLILPPEDFSEIQWRTTVQKAGLRDFSDVDFVFKTSDGTWEEAL